MEAYADPLTSDDKEDDLIQWLSDIHSTAATHSLDNSSPCRKRKRQCTMSRPSSDSPPAELSVWDYCSVKEESPHLRAVQAKSLESKQLASPSERHIEGLELIEMATHPPSTPSKSNSKVQTVTKNTENIRNQLAKAGLWFEHLDAYNAHSKLQQLVEEILGVNVASPVMRDESVRKIQQQRKENATCNESTILDPNMDLVIKTQRTVIEEHSRKRDADQMLQEQVEDCLESLAKDLDFSEKGLKHRRDSLYLSSLLPGQTDKTNALGLTNPKPDRTYGFKIPLYPTPGKGYALASPEIEAMMQVCPGIRNPFFAIERKGPEGSIEEAENQAMRAGATLVNARRQLNAKAAAAKATRAGTPSAPAPLITNVADLDSIAFTVSWTPRFAELHVHWHETVAGGGEIWHMTPVDSYVLDRNVELKKFRKAAGDVLQWGCYKRMNEVEKDLKQIYPNF